MRFFKLIYGFLWTVSFSIGMVVLMGNQSKSAIMQSRAQVELQTHFTPIVMSVLTRPHPVTGSDGRIHFVYELQLINASSFTLQVESLKVLDGTRDDKVLAEFSEKEIPQNMQELITKSSTDTIESGQAAIFFVHFTRKKEEPQIPVLAHSLTISGDFPPGFTRFMDLPESESQLVELGGFLEIHPSPPIVLGPPLEGSGWIAADGCCTAKRHIRAMMPINGQLRVAQRFAIDWVLVDKDHRLFAGDLSDVKSYVAYGQKVLAVAESTVIGLVDEYKDQVPGILPSNITLAEAEGNHIVLDLGNDQFAFYAHLKPGSVKARGLKVGDRVCRGQVLGLVGNSGNTTAPHLHFHMMASPSTLGSDGLPYVIDNFDLLGRTPSIEAFDKAEQDGTPLAIQAVDNSGTHSEELPLDLSVVRFPVSQKCAPSTK